MIKTKIWQTAGIIVVLTVLLYGIVAYAETTIIIKVLLCALGCAGGYYWVVWNWRRLSKNAVK